MEFVSDTVWIKKKTAGSCAGLWTVYDMATWVWKRMVYDVATWVWKRMVYDMAAWIRKRTVYDIGRLTPEGEGIDNDIIDCQLL